MPIAPRHPGRPVRTVRPCSLRELVDAVLAAERDGLCVRAIGAGRSFSSVLATDGVCLRTDGLKRLLSVDPEQLRDGVDADGLVAVEGGMLVRRLQRKLRRRGRELDNTAAFTGQTIAGAVGTASHGTGLALAPMCDQVVSLVLVTSGGRVVRIEPSHGPTDPRRHDEHGVELRIDDDLFHSTVAGLGAMGVIYSLTLRTRPASWLVEHRQMRRLDEVRREIAETGILNESRHYQVLLNPYADADGVRWCCVTDRRPSGPPSFWDRLRPRQRLVPTLASRLPLERLLTARLDRDPDAIAATLTQALQSTACAPLVGPAHRILDNWPLNVCAEAHAIELAVPLNRWDDALQAILDLAAERAAEGNYLTAPISVRFVARSKHLLTPTFRGPMCIIEVVSLKRTTFGRDELLPYARLLSRFGGRLHFGLDVLGLQGPGDLHARYPELARWRRARQRLGVSETFDTPWLRRIGLTDGRQRLRLAG